MTTPTLAEAVRRQPYPDYQRWWPVGRRFVEFMAGAILPEWRAVRGELSAVVSFVEEYTRLVYSRESRAGLVEDFVDGPGPDAFFSGEFDALSYAFYRDAFERLAGDAGSGASAQTRRGFTRRVGQRFFEQLSGHLGLDLPRQLADADDFARLQQAIAQTGDFLLAEGYLRDHFAFRFDVTAARGGQAIRQTADDFLAAVQGGVAYALYEMGYPIILPSAVYLYQTVGEAQHHSSRTIEELFARCGCRAGETDDFDPTGFPSELVVELWEIGVRREA